MSLVASATLLGLQIAAGAVYWRLVGRHCHLAKTFVRGIYLVVSSLATVPYPPLHKGVARARW